MEAERKSWQATSVKTYQIVSHDRNSYSGRCRNKKLLKLYEPLWPCLHDYIRPRVCACLSPLTFLEVYCDWNKLPQCPSSIPPKDPQK